MTIVPTLGDLIQMNTDGKVMGRRTLTAKKPELELEQDSTNTSTVERKAKSKQININSISYPTIRFITNCKASC